MKKYYQHIPTGISKKKLKKGQKPEIVPARRVLHEKPLTAFQEKLKSLRAYLYDIYGVHSFTQLKISKEQLIKAKHKAFKAVGITQYKV